MNTKVTAVAFRVVIILTLIAITVSAGMLIYALVDTYSSYDGDIEDYLFNELVEPLRNSANCYYIAFSGTLVALVLSLFARKYCSAVSVVFRTLSIAVCSVVLWLGMGANHVFAFTAKFATELRDVKDLDELDRTDFGISKWQWDSMESALDNEGIMTCYVAAFAVTVLVFFVLTFTSIHYLTKNKDENITEDYAVSFSGEQVQPYQSQYLNEYQNEFQNQTEDDYYNNY